MNELKKLYLKNTQEIEDLKKQRRQKIEKLKVNCEITLKDGIASGSLFLKLSQEIKTLDNRILQAKFDNKKLEIALKKEN